MSLKRSALALALAMVPFRFGPDPARGEAPRRCSPKSSKAFVPKVKDEKYTRSIGLQVILHVDRKLPIVPWKGP